MEYAYFPVLYRWKEKASKSNLPQYFFWLNIPWGIFEHQDMDMGQILVKKGGEKNWVSMVVSTVTAGGDEI